MARWTKRLWTDEEKRSICFQTTAPGVSVAQVARRYAMNANVVFKWLRDPSYAPEAEPVVEARATDVACFLPMEPDWVVRHARAITFQLAEVTVTGTMIRAILAAIHRLRAPPSCA